jgi:branched-chain amino acid transport system substrate-binding protein
MTLSPVGADLLVQELGDEARGIGISQVMPYPGTTPRRWYANTRSCSARMENSSYYGVEAYAMAKVLVDAMRKAGKDLSREKLVASLEGMQNHDLGGYRVSYSANDRGWVPVLSI